MYHAWLNPSTLNPQPTINEGICYISETPGFAGASLSFYQPQGDKADAYTGECFCIIIGRAILYEAHNPAAFPDEFSVMDYDDGSLLDLASVYDLPPFKDF